MSKIKEYFERIPDPRCQGKCLHLLSDILLIGLLTYLSNGEDYEDMVIFAESKGALFPNLLILPKGVPSHDTFNRVFQLIDKQFLRDCLAAHGRDILDILSEKQIAIDGKKLKGVSPTSKGNSGLYIVNAWVSENRLCIGQEKIEQKSNEIIAIPNVLKQIDLTEAVVSIDAIGCQTAIAKQIKSQEGHYLLAVKGNQKRLFEEIEGSFEGLRPVLMKDEWEYDHGRYETRISSILPAKGNISEEIIQNWEGIETLVRIESSRMTKGTITKEVRYYISDEKVANPLYFNRLVRGHWSIENHLHWHLDVTFKEDDCRARKGNAPENLASLRKLALQIITQTKDKLSLKKRRVKAAFDIDYLKKITKI
jgi:predicted transposase YbfD/YdcC